MTAVQQRLRGEIWRDIDPFDCGNSFKDRVDLQGWTSDHVYLKRAVMELRPEIIVEVGVWKGGSVITMANTAKALGLDSVVIAVDTWLGASEHWTQDAWRASLALEEGYPTLFQTFRSNIRFQELCDFVVPVPLDSINAADLLAAKGIFASLIHIDAGHSYESVLSDLRVWWPRLRSDGILIGDDYHPEGVDVWPEVRKAFHDFFGTNNIENLGGKCIIRKKDLQGAVIGMNANDKL